MEPRFQTSFIPKKPIGTTQNLSTPVVHTTNIFSLVANVVFIVILLVSGSLFGYQKILNTQILEADQAVNEARAAFQLDKIQELVDANARMMASDGLLNRHVAVSKLLTFLQDVTLKKVRFDEFTYRSDENAQSIAMKVEAESYNSLASQGEIFSENEFIESPYFFSFSPEENGFVSASFFSTLDPSLVSYKKAVESLSLSQ